MKNKITAMIVFLTLVQSAPSFAMMDSIKRFATDYPAVFAITTFFLIPGAEATRRTCKNAFIASATMQPLNDYLNLENAPEDVEKDGKYIGFGKAYGNALVNHGSLLFALATLYSWRPESFRNAANIAYADACANPLLAMIATGVVSFALNGINFKLVGKKNE